MCGRFSFTSTEKKLVKHFPTLKQSSAIRFSYNVAPSQHAYVITKNEPEKLEYMVWGLVPFWAKDNNASLSNINARSEVWLSDEADGTALLGLLLLRWSRYLTNQVWVSVRVMIGKVKG